MVLVWAEVKLIIFTVAGMGLYFSFVLNTGLIIERSFVIVKQGFLNCWAREEVGGAGEVGRRHSQDK